MTRYRSGRALPVFLWGVSTGVIVTLLGVHFYKGFVPPIADGDFAQFAEDSVLVISSDDARSLESAALFGNIEPSHGVDEAAESGLMQGAPLAGLDHDKQTDEYAAFLKLSATFRAKNYEAVLQQFKAYTWATHLAKAEAIAARALGHLALVFEDLRSEALAALAIQITQNPTQPDFYILRAQVLVDQGLVYQALDDLTQGQQWVYSPQALEALIKTRHAVYSRHLRFLIRNGLWSEVIVFAQDVVIEQGSEPYVALQLALAQAYAAVFDWARAQQALSLAALSSPGDARVSAAQEQVDALYRRRQAQKIDGVASEWFDVAAQRLGDGLVVEVALGNGATVRLLVDTGATISTLNQTVFDSVGSGLPARHLGTRAFISASGKFEAPVIMLEQLTVPPVSAQNIEFALIAGDAPGIDGLLGMNFLKYFEFSVDVSVPELRLRLK
jgi:clan AA aspartic protease (TIGR02281 family)